MTQTAPDTTLAAAKHDGARRHVHVLIIGSGFAGLGAAIRLTQDGRTHFLVIERGAEVGGTWRDNTYPGAACDVPSHLYSYSFELNPNWSRSFSPQPEIQDYLRNVAAKYNLGDKHLFDTDVTHARWDAASNRWLVDTTSGDFTADVLVGAVGALAEPQLPPISGIDTFAGDVFHSARWNHDADLAGKRVALIGTGASAIQIGPAISDPNSDTSVGRLDVYQRTAPWVMPRRDRDYTRVESLAYRHVPGLQRLAREAIYWGREAFMIGFGYRPELLAAAQKIAEGNIAKGIENRALRKAVTPDWRLGCKRILLSNTWYPMLARDNVDLVTDGIAEIRGNTIVSNDGTEREVDAIVVATGFHVTDSPTFERIVGAGGRSLAQVFDAEGMQAYKGASVAGFPNLVFIVGPNTGLGHTSMVYMIESHLNYLSSALHKIDSQGVATFDVRPEVQEAYNAGLQQRMKHTVWSTGGCASWYQDKHGNNTTLWPRFTFEFRRLTRRFDLGDYAITRAAVDDRRDAQPAAAAGNPVVRVRPARPDRPTERSTAMTDLQNKVVVITGAGSGIGRALACDFARRGALLAVSDVDATGLAQTVKQLGVIGARVHHASLDVTDRAAVLAYAEDVATEFGKVNIVVNNAGIAFTGEIEKMSFENIERVMDVDFWGVVHGTKAFLPHLIASGDGHVVNISSLFGLLSMPGQSAYNAAKFAVRGFTESLREEMLIAGHPVRVTCVHPGGIKTAIARNAGVVDGEDQASLAEFFDAKLAKTSPEDAAKSIRRAVIGNRPRAVIGWDAKFLDLLVRVTGPGYQRLVALGAARAMPKAAPAAAAHISEAAAAKDTRASA